MAGKFRRKFVDIISDTITEHFQGKVHENELSVVLVELRKLIGKLELCCQKGKVQRAESLRKLKKLPLEKLQSLLSEGN